MFYPMPNIKTMSDYIHPNHGYPSIVETDNVPSILQNSQEETIGGQHASVTTYTEFERPTERQDVTDEGNENSELSNEIVVNVNGRECQQESSQDGTTEALVISGSLTEHRLISGSLTEHRRERIAQRNPVVALPALATVTSNADVGFGKYADYRRRLKSFKGYAKKWPHRNPSAKDMARANFIFRGSDRHPDAVQCYLCGNTFHTIQETDVPDNLCNCNL
ncbi:hypothetical protein MAR_023590 [Mya arenaria]|uniref:ZF-HD dimerization-type domain-containing protein n=1 Tax=Mya arenaria TaxID=6604 RepID=A0ABY7DNE6_MYAAR|nr:hypothetical protein MAR_023590 [Mya arenaria]